MFNLDNFVADCKSAVRRDPTHHSVAALLTKAVENPSAIIDALGEPTESGITPIYKSPELTIVNVVWRPHMTIMPHNHEMWATIGIYGGREDNIFWRRIKDDPLGHIEAAGARALGTGDCVPLGKDIIHSVTNPIDKLTGAIHIYGGDFFEEERSEWDPESLTEHAYDMDAVKALFSDN